MPHRQQRGRRQAASQGVHAQQFRILTPRKHCIGDGDRGHGEKNKPVRPQVINAGGSPEREIRNAGAQRLQAIGKRGKSLTAKALRPKRQRGSTGQADQDSNSGPNPVPIKGQFQKPGHADEDGQDADTIQELGPDPALQRRTRLGACRRSHPATRGRRGRNHASGRRRIGLGYP